jgi:hypothetical protein
MEYYIIILQIIIGKDYILKFSYCDWKGEQNAQALHRKHRVADNIDTDMLACGTDIFLHEI